jgi:uncharacterized protein YbjQ (UPF0145 family)
MRNLNDILVTTTSTIEGMIIKQYIKPISAHVVAGTNFFSDFFASFSDVFGGRSQTYQRQLSSIYSESVEILKQSAYQIGANCILGLKVDLDEISGKGKSMFMITATGTAVRIENLSKGHIEDHQNEKLEALSIDKMTELRKREKLIQLAIDDKLELDDATWDFLSQNKVIEISKHIMAMIQSMCLNQPNINQQSILSDKNYQHLLTYLTSFKEEERITIVYDYLMNENVGSFAIILNRLIGDLLVFDAKKLQVYLQDKNVENRIKALQIVVKDKSFFSKEDIPEFEALINLIHNNFSKTATQTAVKKLLSSKLVDVWICECGHKNDLTSDYCEDFNCGKDQYGFTKGQISPAFAIRKLNENIELIKKYVA